jgi:ketosteroid isomerase-like protein
MRTGRPITDQSNSAPVRTARETVQRYLDVLYNQRRLDLIPELIADPTWRHKAGEVKSLTMADTIERLEQTLDLCPELHFDTVVLHDDGAMATVNWNGRSTQRDGRSFEYCGIEVFRVVDGKIVEIRNSRETGGHWQPSQTFSP